MAPSVNSTKEAAPTKRLVQDLSGSAAQQWIPTAQLYHQRLADKDREIDKCVKTGQGEGRQG